MAGKLIVDTIDTDNAFITLNVQQSQIATMNVSGIYSNTGVKMIGANGTVSNTAITGNIISSQIAPSVTLTTPIISGNLNLDSAGTTGIRVPSANTIAFHTAGTEDFRIDSNGYVTTPSQPKFWVAKNNGTASTGTPVLWNDIKFNIGSGYNASTGRFTAPVTGYYFITATGINQGTTNVLIELLIMLNGTNVASARGYHAANGTVGGATVTQIINLTAGDYVTINPDVTTMYGAESRTAFFCGYLLG